MDDALLFVGIFEACTFGLGTRSVVRGIRAWLKWAARLNPSRHLRGRKPVECGAGTVSETQLREVAVVTRVKRQPLLRSEGVTDPSWDDVIQAQLGRERDARRLALEHERDRQRRMANQPWRDREQAAQMQSRNVCAEFQQDRNSEARRPTPIENAIRNSQERGTW